jgi:hypothetical protein
VEDFFQKKLFVSSIPTVDPHEKRDKPDREKEKNISCVAKISVYLDHQTTGELIHVPSPLLQMISHPLTPL